MPLKTPHRPPSNIRPKKLANGLIKPGFSLEFLTRSGGVGCSPIDYPASGLKHPVSPMFRRTPFPVS